MKLEEILPEIRKGRKFRPSIAWEWCGIESVPTFSIQYILGSTWELEPIKKEISKEDIRRAWDKYACACLSRAGILSFELFCAELGFK